MLADLHWLRPLWFVAFAPLAVALVWLWRRRPGWQRWQGIVDDELAPHVLTGGGGARRYPLVLVGLAGTLAIVALAGPAWQKMPAPVFASEDTLVIALDLSRSMDTEDVAPSRLARARFKIADIVNRRDEGQTALIVYAAEAFTVSPLTDDVQTLLAQLPALEPGLMPAQGSRADRAIVRARALLEQAGQSRGDVLLITDGAEPVRTGAAARELAQAGYRLSVLGVGTPEGGPIPGDDSFVRRRDGSIVISSLDRGALADLAGAGGGIYQDLTPDPRDVERLATLFEARRPRAVDDSGLEADIWREEGPWLLLPLLPLAALAFRRGVLVAVAALVLLPPLPAQAAGLADLFSRPDQRAARALAAGDAGQAADLFRDPAWKAAAEYRAGNFDQALQALEGLDGPDAHYNRGNALARLGRYEAAIAAYEQALELHPDHDDARFNRDLLRERLQQQQQAQQSGQDESTADTAQPEADGDQAGQTQSGDRPQDDAAAQGGQPQDDDTQHGADPEQDNQRSADSQQDSGQSGPAGAADPASGDDRQAAGSPDESTQDTGQGNEAVANDDPADDGDTQSEQMSRTAQAAESSEPDNDAAAQPALAASDEAPDESEQAIEQWLRRIPDDPGGLLRRKFLYQYRRQQPPEQEQQQW